MNALLLESSHSNYSQYFLSSSQKHIIGYVYIASSTLSILGSASIVFIAAVRRRVCMSEVNPIFQLSLGDLLASALLMTSVLMFLTENQPNGVCTWINSITMALYVTTFLLTMMYAVEVLRRMKVRLSNIYANLSQTHQTCTRGMTTGYIISWSVPLVTCILLNVIHGQDPMVPRRIIPPALDCANCLPIFHYNEGICWEDEGLIKEKNIAGKYLFLVPLISVVLINFVLYALSMYVYRQTQITRGVLGYHQYKEEARVRKQAFMYQAVFFICWLPSLLLGFISLTPVFNMRKFFPLYIIQASISPLQGFLNCVIYGWWRRGFVQALRETTPLINTHLPRYSSASL